MTRETAIKLFESKKVRSVCDSAVEEGRVQNVADVAIFLLQQTEGQWWVGSS